MENLQEIAKFFATICSGLFAGAAIYINLVEHPARIECGPEIAVREFGPSYRRASVLQVALALLGCVASITAWLMGSSILWLVGGIILVSVIPFTLIIIFPINKKLLDPMLDKKSPEVQHLFSRWNLLHGVRSLLSLVALIIFVFSNIAGY